MSVPEDLRVDELSTLLEIFQAPDVADDTAELNAPLKMFQLPWRTAVL